MVCWCSLFWTNKNTPIRQQKKSSSVHCRDSGWWSMPIFSGPAGVFLARNIMLNSQLSSKFVQFFGKHGWLHKIHSKLNKTRNNKYIVDCFADVWIWSGFCVANPWFFQTYNPSMFHSSLLCWANPWLFLNHQTTSTSPNLRSCEHSAMAMASLCPNRPRILFVEDLVGDAWSMGVDVQFN